MNIKNAVRAAVYRAIANAFDYPHGDINDHTCAIDVAGWDSISNAFVIIDIEEMLDFPLPLEKIVEANNVGDMIEIICDSMAAQDSKSA